MIIGEVVETKTAFKPNQKDDEGNVLPLGSIQVRIASHDSNLGQVRNVYARPALWNRRVPLIGEHVMMMTAPTNDYTTDDVTSRGFIYYSPINATDDLVLHQMPKAYTRSQDKKLPPKGQRLADKEIPGYTFPKSPPTVSPIQPFEGDEIFQGRFGTSIRFGSTVVGNMSVYAKKPTWNGASNGDPLMIMRVTKPNGGGDYTIEDLGKDDASIYMVTSQILNKFKAGFNKNLDVKTIGTWKGNSQIVIDGERVIINAKKDKAFFIGSTDAIITAEKVLFQSSKYKVDLDELMDFLKKWLEQDKNLATASAQYSTACGPTAVATNAAQFVKLATADFQKFKLP